MEMIRGNLLDACERVIAHGCNTRGVMGAGIAGQIAKRWPLVRETNKDSLCLSQHGFRAGACQPVWLPPYMRQGTTPECVVNLATQIDPGPCARLHFVRLAFANMAEWCAIEGVHRVAIPQIGCGIGGLQWADVEPTIEEAISDVIDRGHLLQVVCYVL